METTLTMCVVPNSQGSWGYDIGCRCDKHRKLHAAANLKWHTKYKQRENKKTRERKSRNYDQYRNTKMRWKEANPGPIRDYHLRYKFGISLAEYNAILLGQNSVCAICKRSSSDFKKAFAVDHCHETKKNRGLLCMYCNTALGKFGDSIDLLQRAISYLQKWKGD